MSESNMRSKVIKVLAPLKGVPVENIVYSGYPDISYTRGVIECKWEKAWPKRPSTVLRLTSTFTPQQRRFLIEWCEAGGQGHLLLQVGQQWMLFWGPVAAKVLGSLPRVGLLEQVERVWSSRTQMEEELVPCLSRRVI